MISPSSEAESVKMFHATSEKTGKYSEEGQVCHRVINSKISHMRKSFLMVKMVRLWISLQARGVKALLLKSFK